LTTFGLIISIVILIWFTVGSIGGMVASYLFAGKVTWETITCSMLSVLVIALWVSLATYY
jgi:cation transporter-like permease